MVGRDRVMIFSSRANLVLMKQRIGSAEKGLSLLKRKRDALDFYLRQLSADLRQQHEKQNIVVQDAIFSMAKARFLRTDFKPALVMSPQQADVYLLIKNSKIVGMTVPTFELVIRSSNALNLTGLANGRQQVLIVREKFQEAIKVLVAVASLRYSVALISRAVKQNNMRVNGLEYVVLPRYQNTVEYIREELDELEREEFYRLKCSQAKQFKKKSEFMKLLRQRHQKDTSEYVGIDFTDTHLQTPLEAILAAKPGDIMQGPRRTVSKIYNKTIIIEKEDNTPLYLDVKLSDISIKKPMDIKDEQVATPSSSSSLESYSTD